MGMSPNYVKADGARDGIYYNVKSGTWRYTLILKGFSFCKSNFKSKEEAIKAKQKFIDSMEEEVQERRRIKSKAAENQRLLDNCMQIVEILKR